MRIAPLLLLLLTLTQACGDGGADPPDAGGSPPDAGGSPPDAGVPLDDAGQPIDPPDAGPAPDAPVAVVVITACASGGGDYATIQAAVDAAPPGARVEICPGTYVENVVVAKSIELVGDSDVIIDGHDSGPALTVTGVTGPAARVAHLVLTNGRGGTLGGGGLLAQDSALEALDLVIEGNAANRGAGAAIHGGDVDLHDSTIRANHANDRGGGLFVAANASIRSVTIEDNSADGKGGGFFVDGFAPVFSSVTVTGNSSLADGGGGQLYMTAATVEHSTFTGNDSFDDAGGLRLHVAQAIVRNNEFLNNLAGDGDGGGVKVSHDRSEITDNLFEGNVAAGAGGGLEVDDDRSVVARNIFRNNESRRGGGVRVALIRSPMSLEDNLFDGNVAELRGGGVLVENNEAAVTLVRNTFTGNQAARGGSFAASAAPFVLTNSLMTGGGGAGAESGSAAYLSSASGTIAFVVAVDNGDTAPAFRFIESTVTVHSSILAGDVRVDGAVPTWRYNDLYPAGFFEGMADPTGVDGNLSVDPLFGGEHRLSAGSPLVDAGDPAFADLDGTPADMGMYGGPDAP